MYTVAFYSHRDGLERTRALANVAVELARRGRKVLVVDFNLEAPTLDSLELFRPADEQPRRGLLEYITAFRRRGAEPDVLDYLHEAPRAAEGAKPEGKVWVMPAGRWDRRGYRLALARLDWLKLYRKGGFELFERTRARWQEGRDPDYVLLDCPSGWSNAAGVCTRQLADAVVALCPAREPERSRTATLLEEVAMETSRGRPNASAIHFVWYDLPLHADPDAWLHHLAPYNDLEPAAALVREVPLGTVDAVPIRGEPDSEMARQYHLLTDAILVGNVKDPDGAQLFLARMKQVYVKAVAGCEREVEERRLDTIEDHFWEDPEVLLRAGDCLVTGRRFRDAIRYLNQVLELRPRLPSALFLRASCYHYLGRRDAARTDLLAFLDGTEGSHSQTVRGLRELYMVAPEEFEEVRRKLEAHGPNSREQMVRLHDRFILNGLVHELRVPEVLVFSDPRFSSYEPARLNEDSELPEWVRALPPREKSKLQTLLEAEFEPRINIRSLICEGRFDQAFRVMNPRGRDLREMELEDLIDLAMVRWGRDDELPEDVCAAIQNRDAELAPEDRKGPTYGQVIALALWRVGEKEEARKRLVEARQEAAHWFSGERGNNGPINSLDSRWRYTDVSFDQFTEDCDQILRLISGAPIRPPFMDRLARS